MEIQDYDQAVSVKRLHSFHCKKHLLFFHLYNSLPNSPVFLSSIADTEQVYPV